MKLYEHDGTPRQAGMAGARLGQRFGDFSILGLLEGVVLRAFYKDDSANKSKTWTEYTVMEVSSREIFRNARVLADVSGFSDGKEETLAETTSTTDGSALVVEEEGLVAGVTAQVVSPTSSLGLTPTTKLNGERVVFGTVGGAKSQPVIVGCLPHTEGSYFATRDEAPRSYRQINGWTHVFDKDGALIFQHTDGRKITANADGSIDVVPKDGQVLRLGGDTFSAVRGETNNQNIAAVIEQLGNLVELFNGYAAAIQAIADPTNAVTPTLTSALATITSSLGTISATLDQALSPTPKVP